jgi:Na+-driven multidrug efflux pump
MGALFLVFAPPLVDLSTTEPEVARRAVFGLRVLALGFPLFALGMVLEQAFNGAGDTTTPTWINFGVLWALQIPLAWLLASHLGLRDRGVGLLFRRGAWKHRVV